MAFFYNVGTREFIHVMFPAMSLARQAISYKSLHHNRSAQLLHRRKDLLGFVLRYGFLHHLWCALNKLLRVDQAKA